MFLVVRHSGKKRAEGHERGDGSERLGSAFQKYRKPGLIVAKLRPGSYEIGRLMGNSKGYAHLNFNLQGQFDVPPASVVYLGHMKIHNREKRTRSEQTTSDPLSGSALDAIAGFSQGTLDIVLEDRYETDIVEAADAVRAFRAARVVRTPIAQLTLKGASGHRDADRTVKLVR